MPGLAELRSRRGNALGERDGAGQQRVLGRTRSPSRGARPPPACEGAGGRQTLRRSLGLYCLPCKHRSQVNLCLNAFSRSSLDASLTPTRYSASPQLEKGEEETRKPARCWSPPCSSVRTTIQLEGHTRAHTCTPIQSS